MNQTKRIEQIVQVPNRDINNNVTIASVTEEFNVPESEYNFTDVVIPRDLLSNEDLDVFIIVVMIAICSPITLFGLMANAINVVIFYKQGFTDSVNISLFALSISDLGSLLTILYSNISLSPWLASANLNIQPRDVMFLVGAWPHISFSRITCWITVFITCERCLCISMPFKVKVIFVPKLVIPVLIVIFVISAVGIVPVYFSFKLKWDFDPFRNMSILHQIVEAEKSELIASTYFQIFLQFASFATITILTEILIIKLRQTTKWRASAASSGEQSGAISNRDRRIVRMIILITCILIVCYIPSMLLQMVWLIEPRFSTGGQYNNTQMACWLIGFLTEGINSSVTILVYYNMSSTYRQIFVSIFGIKTEKTVNKK